MREQFIAPGPIFEPGPGWGGKLKRWLKKYALGSDCALCRSARYVLILGLVFFLLLTPQINQNKKTPPTTENNISEIVRPGDNQTYLARRVLAKYLVQNTKPVLTNGQKVFLETALREIIPNRLIHSGNEITIETTKIKMAIEKIKLLSASQLQKWEKYAEDVKF